MQLARQVDKQHVSSRTVLVAQLMPLFLKIHAANIDTIYRKSERCLSRAGVGVWSQNERHTPHRIDEHERD